MLYNHIETICCTERIQYSTLFVQYTYRNDTVLYVVLKTVHDYLYSTLLMMTKVVDYYLIVVIVSTISTFLSLDGHQSSEKQ